MAKAFVFDSTGTVTTSTDTAASTGGSGTVGPKGDKGDKGDQGIAGVGTKGDKGDQGIQGIQGIQGVGVKGDKGDPGVNGTNGADGAASTQAASVAPNGLSYPDGTVQTTAFPGAIALATTAASTGPAVWTNGATLTATAVPMQASGTTLAQTFVPPTGSGFYGAMVTNYSNSAANINVQLYNNTDATPVWTTPASIAPGTVTGYGPFAIATYPMPANKSYIWRISGNGASTASVVPQYFVPSSAPYATQYPVPAYLTTSTALTSTATNLKVAGTTNLTQYYRFPTGGFFTSATFQNFSTTTACVFTLNNISGTLLYTSPSVPANSNLTVGPFGPGQFFMAGATAYQWQVTGNGNATVAVNWAFVG